MLEILGMLLVLVGLIAMVIAVARDPDDDEPATLEGGSSHMRERG